MEHDIRTLPLGKASPLKAVHLPRRSMGTER